MSLEEKEDLLQKIDLALNDVRPHLNVDGGDVKVVDVTDGMVARIQWLGTCEGCYMSAMTMRAGIEQAIISKIPEINGVEAVNGVMI